MGHIHLVYIHIRILYARESLFSNTRLNSRFVNKILLHSGSCKYAGRPILQMCVLINVRACDYEV
jgi:hypothetical protein